MKTGKRSEPFPRAGWLAIAVPVVVVLLVGAVFYSLSKPFPFSTTRNTLPIPGPGATLAAYLPVSGEEQLSITQVVQKDINGHFIPLQPGETEVLNSHGGHSRWYKFILDNPEDDSHFVVLDTVWKAYDFVDLYEQERDGTWKVTSTGSSVYPWHDDASPRWRSVQIMLPAHSSVTVYLHVQDYFRLPVRFVLWPSLDDFFKWEKSTYITFFAYFFTWIVVAAHGAFRYALLRQRDQFFCLLFVVCHGLGTLVGRSVLSLHVEGLPFPFLEMLGNALNCLSISFLFAFSRNFLQTKSTEPASDSHLKRLQVLWLFMPLTSLFILHPPWLFLYLAGLTWLCLLCVGYLLWIVLKRWQAGNPLALLFLTSFLPYFLGFLLIVFSFHGTIAWDEDKRLFALIGNAISLILLSIIPIYRSRGVRREYHDLSSNYAAKLEHDVAEKTRDLQSLSEQLHSALLDRDRVLAIIGHDLRSPLISLQSLVDLLQRKADLTREELIQWSSHIEQACNLQLELLNNLLTWSTQNSSQSKANSSVNLRGAIHHAWGQVQRLAVDKKITLSENIPPGIHVNVKSEVFYTILRNVMVNAIKYSSENNVVHASCVQQNGHGRTTLIIKDYGVGMTKEQLAKMYSGQVESQPGTNGEKGSGIGLSICRDLLHSSSGELLLESIPFKGTSVSITLPTAKVPL